MDLPVEILHRIAGYLRKKDLARICRVSDGFQHVFTPLVYAEIELLDLSVVRKCFRTMSKATEFNLPGMVRSLTIRTERYSTFHFSKAGYAEHEKRFLQCLEGMVGLQDLHLSMTEGFPITPRIFLALANKKLLRSISIFDSLDETGTRNGSIQADWTSFEQTLAPPMPSLKTFQLSQGSIVPDPLQKYLSGLCDRHAEQLQVLALDVRNAEKWGLMHSGVHWPALTTLELRFTAFSTNSFFEHTPNVTSLIIHQPFHVVTSIQVVYIPPNFLPRLTRVSGPSQILLQTRLLDGRPLLECVEMDNTIIGDTNASNRADSRLRFQAPPWEHVAGVLTQMQGTRVKRISMYMQELSLDSLTGVAPFMKTVEHLVIYLAESWSALDALAPLVFVHLPNLKSFLLSDAPRFKYVDDNWGRFEYAVDSSVQKQILEGWDRNMAGEMRGNAWKLERVGFTALFAWNRQPDRSWLAEEATKDKTMWRNYEDDEDDSSESGSGSGSEEDSESEQSM